MRKLIFIICALIVGSPTISFAQVTPVTPVPPNTAKNAVIETVARVTENNLTVAATTALFLKRPSGTIDSQGNLIGQKPTDDNRFAIDCTTSKGSCDELYPATAKVKDLEDNNKTVAAATNYYYVPGASTFSRGGNLAPATARVYLDGLVIAKTDGWLFTNSITQVLGNVFAKDGTSGKQLDLGNRGVASGGQGIGGFNAFATVEGYKIDPNATIAWQKNDVNKNAAMSSAIANISQNATDISQITGTFNLNPMPDQAGNLNPRSVQIDSSNPEGRVWNYTGPTDLVLTGVKFLGKGTLLVRGKNVIIGSGVTVSSPNNLGLIVVDGGGVTISADAEAFSGVIFCPGTMASAQNRLSGSKDGLVTIEGGTNQLIFRGSIVADSLDLQTRSIGPSGFGVALRYDQRVYQSPPPGFSNLGIVVPQEVR